MLFSVSIRNIPLRKVTDWYIVVQTDWLFCTYCALLMNTEPCTLRCTIYSFVSEHKKYFVVPSMQCTIRYGRVTPDMRCTPVTMSRCSYGRIHRTFCLSTLGFENGLRESFLVDFPSMASDRKKDHNFVALLLINYC